MRRALTWTVTAAITLAVSLAVADKLSDFKDAVGKDGCASIPYEDLRRACTSEQATVHAWCDGENGPVTCGKNITRELKDAVERARRERDAIEARKRELDSQRSRASDDAERDRLTRELEQLERDLADATARVDQAIRDVDARKLLVEKALATLDQCIAHRRVVMNSFGDALDLVRGENDEEIKPLARQLRDKWEASKAGHEIAITNKQNAHSNCWNERP